jgi:hypothetical protein
VALGEERILTEIRALEPVLDRVVRPQLDDELHRELPER